MCPQAACLGFVAGECSFLPRFVVFGLGFSVFFFLVVLFESVLADFSFFIRFRFVRADELGLGRFEEFDDVVGRRRGVVCGRSASSTEGFAPSFV